MRAGTLMAVLLIAFAAGCSSPHPTNPDMYYDPWKHFAGKTGWSVYPGNPIIEPGKVGEWDSWAVMSMTVVKVGDTFHLYYEGGLTGCGDLQIGHATSADGLCWAKDPENPVLPPGRPGEWDEGATWDPFVIYEDGLFKMWYGGEKKNHRDFQCGYAVSKDGVNFEKKGKISNFPGGEMADMHVFHDKKAGRYYMYYWDRRFKNADRLRRATSPNETDFDFDNAVPIRIEGERPGHRYTHVFREDGRYYMYYGFDGGPPRSGYATSSDLLHWKAANTRLAETEDAEILKVAHRLYFMLYCPAAFQDETGCDIRLAIFSGHLHKLALKD
ncbi:MAG: glycoside hydrolase family protein [Planctomycetota bacterium]